MELHVKLGQSAILGCLIFSVCAIAKDVSDEQLAEAVKTENVELVNQWIEDGGDVNYK